MSNEDKMLRQWFDLLSMIRDCAADINHETASSVAAFYKQKHSSILIDEHAREQLAFCFFRKTGGNAGVGISITKNDFKNASTHRELLDSCFRPVRLSVRAVFRTVSNADPDEFEERKTSTLFPTDEAVDTLCNTLAEDMLTFPKGEKLQDFKRLLKKTDSRVADALNALL